MQYMSYRKEVETEDEVVKRKAQPAQDGIEV